jgi:nucleotide-binding universal stress UspA family protein
MIEVKKILYPVDFTEHSTKILPYVLSMREKYDGTIYLLHVVEDLSSWGRGLYIPHLSYDVLHKDALAAAEKSLAKVCEEDLSGCPSFIRKVVIGDPVGEILKYIDEEKIDLVVMGTHGARGLEHRVFGSVADNVVRKSPVPVMVINPHKMKSP